VSVGLLAAACAVALFRTLASSSVPVASGWRDAVLVILAALTTLISLSNRLPLQNVLLAALLAGALGSLGQAFGSWAALSFIQGAETAMAGPGLFQGWAWWTPCWWVVAILSSRGMAQLILCRRRQANAYGFELMALTLGLSLVLDLGSESYAGIVKGSWHWKSAGAVPASPGMAVMHLVGWGFMTLLILIFVTPVLINKKPGRFLPAFDLPSVWIILAFFSAMEAALRHLWWTAGIGGMAAVAALFSAARSAWLQRRPS
jgi:hypothetical protein